jgi:hypothetical protein
MARFIDILLREKLINPISPLRPVIVADELASELENESVSNAKRVLSHVTDTLYLPPFNRFWIESKGLKKWGLIGCSVLYAQSDVLLADVKFEHLFIRENAQRCKWVMMIEAYEYIDKRIYKSEKSMVYFVIENGGLLTNERGVITYILNADKDISRFDGVIDVPDLICIVSAIALRAIAIINCINVELEPHAPHPALSKSHQKKYRIPMSSWYELRLKTKRYAKDEEGVRGVSGDRIKMREHLVRGHFKRRSSGVYWWSSHVRGEHDLGTIVKSYNLPASEEIHA